MAAPDDYDMHKGVLESFMSIVQEAYDEEKRGNNDEARKKFVNLMKNIVSLYNTANDYNHAWTYTELQEGVMSMKGVEKKFQENICFYVEAVYKMGKNTGQDTENHAAINVRGDGSCFYQTLFYSLLWVRPDDVRAVNSVHELKMHIIRNMFGSKPFKDIEKRLEKALNEKKKDGRADRTEVNAARRDLLLFQDLTEGIGLVVKKKRSAPEREEYSTDNSKFFETSFTDHVADVFDIQILIYASAGIDGQATYLPCEKDHKTLNGLPVVLLLLKNAHFYVLSKEPFMAKGLLNENGKGIAGKVIPQSIEFRHFKQENIMPYLNMCFLCKRLMLSD
jgi:hypothetical protein